MWKLGTSAIVLALMAIPAQGQELIFGANVGARWDSNVNNVPHGDSDFSARVGPEVRLRNEQGDLTYDIHYVPTYQAYSRFANLDDWDQLVTSTITYQLGAATSLRIQDLFDYAPVTTNFLQQVATTPGVPIGTQFINALGRYTILVNTASIDLKHAWNELWSSEAILTSFYQDPKIQNGVSSSNSTAQGKVTYAITQRDLMGAALGATVQQFGSNNLQQGTTSYFYNLSGVWDHQFSPTWTLDLEAGPTLSNPGSVSTAPASATAQFPNLSIGGSNALLFDFKNCPTVSGVQGVRTGQSLLNLCGFPSVLATPNTSPTFSQANTSVVVPILGLSQGSQTSLTYFANILMTKRWETVTATLAYARSAGTSGLFSTSTEVDTVNGGLLWDASPVWQTGLNVIWSDQGSSSNSAVAIREVVQPSMGFTTSVAQATGFVLQQQKSSINVYQFIVALHSEYKITKRLRVFGNVFFLNQTSSQGGAQALNLSSLNYDATRIDLGFHYEFDPIHL